MDLVSKRKYFFVLSAILLIPGVVSLLWPPGLRLGIDFTGGSTLDYTFTVPVSEETLRSQFIDLGHPEAIIQKTGDRSFFIRTSTLSEDTTSGGASEKDSIDKALAKNIAPIESVGFFSVSPKVAGETVRNAVIAVIAAALGILLYISYAFRRVPNPFRYGSCAIVALVHDTLLVVGVFSVLGKVANLEVNAMFIIGVLTVIGYSVHDTIVVFDRIRENVSNGVGRSLESTINVSILETLGRSFNTSLTLVFTLVALILFGGPTIFNFLLVLLIGIVSGTYSSIAIASQVLVVWERGEFPRFFPRRSKSATTD